MTHSQIKEQKLKLFTVLFVSVFLISTASIETQAQPEATIYLDSTKQIIRGFGAANIVGWRPDMTEADVENAFGMDEGQLGFSILRIRIPPQQNQWSNNLPTAKKAYEMGAKVIASPWSPPAEMKSNGSTTGGRLKDESYQDYADHLQAFAVFMEENGVPLHAISVQNEPDIEVGYESCDWTPDEMTKFMKENAGSIEVPIIAPESFQFRKPISDAILSDSAAAANLDIVGGHIYGGGLGAYPLAEEMGKEIWMTEYLMNKNATSNWSELGEEVIWDETVDMLVTIQRSMQSNWNAYIWWYLKRYYSFIGEGDQGTTSGEILKRGYAFSQFSKFIRPGFVRLDIDGPFGRGYERVYVTAYTDSSKAFVVAVNGESSEKEVTFVLEGKSTPSFSRYITSETQNVEKIENIEVTGTSFTTTLPPKSVITYLSGDLLTSTDEVKPEIPASFSLDQNYPNPFNPSTMIRYQLPVSSEVSLKIFDMLGREVATLVDGRRSDGVHGVSFDASKLSSGIYIYRLKAGEFVQTRQMTLIK